MATTNEDRRQIMNMAWTFRRAEPTRSFSSCLKGAWAYSKKLARAAQRFMAGARKAGGVVRLSPSLIRSPLGRKWGHGSRQDWDAAYTTAVIGG